MDGWKPRMHLLARCFHPRQSSASFLHMCQNCNCTLSCQPHHKCLPAQAACSLLAPSTTSVMHSRQWCRARTRQLRLTTCGAARLPSFPAHHSCPRPRPTPEQRRGLRRADGVPSRQQRRRVGCSLHQLVAQPRRLHTQQNERLLGETQMGHVGSPPPRSRSPRGAASAAGTSAGLAASASQPVSQRPASSGSRRHTFSSQPVSSGSRPLPPTAPGAACGSRRPPRGLGAGQMCPACTFCS